MTITDVTEAAVRRGKHNWIWHLTGMILTVSLLTAVLVGLSLALTLPMGGYLYSAAMWGIVPAVGAACAYLSTRRGLSNYVSWLLPPVCQTTAHWILLGYPPQSAMMPVITAIVSLISAAVAQVLNEREKQKTHHK